MSLLKRLQSYSMIQKAIPAMPKLILLLSFGIPMLVLYSLYPSSFSMTWKGRTFYLFFLWFIFLELTLSWEEIQLKAKGLFSLRNILFGTTLLLPTLYIVIANYFGLNNAIFDISTQLQIHPNLRIYMPLAIEYLIFTAIFALILLVGFGLDGLKEFSISTVFLGTIGGIYMIDNLYPEGAFTPFQMIVPTTAFLAANVLYLIGYQTTIFYLPGKPRVPHLTVNDSSGNALITYGVAWPCAGVQSLIIYSFVILVFFRKTAIPMFHRVVYFAIGAIITYMVNILRITSIYLVYINNIGNDPAQAASAFHNYYGGLYSMIWILVYPLLIIFTRIVWKKISDNRLNKSLMNT